ncbi:MAG: NAD(P)H-hydrate dehydratase [Flavobacteriales bacterium]|nr:NAD(P)H-hydrate dehydratase [Flavobacteriales bacterium]MCB9447678.1 NAD(P)H-hydrate dehydratase [Flavobacteriales bacterium]
MKILSASQTREVDAYTIEHEPVASVDLMERAASACAVWIRNQYPEAPSVSLFCGKGNNGGDGLAIARLLSKYIKDIAVYVVQYTPEASDDFKANLKLLPKSPKVKVVDVMTDDDLPELAPGTLVIDALFGSGLNRPLEGLPAAVVAHVNASRCVVVSVDVPSGLSCDHTDDVHPDRVICATHTLSFELPKLPFMLPVSQLFVGQWHLLPIGLHPDAIARTDTPWEWLPPAEVAPLLKVRQRFGHKGTYGHALIMAGSYGKMGAAVLASRACLRGGAGLVTVYIPACGYEILQTAQPEVMVLTDEEQRFLTACPPLEIYRAIGVGPGVGTDDRTASMLKLLIQEAPCPLVLDADALNILAENPTWLSFLPQGSILTPHIGEFDRLTGAKPGDCERLQLARDFAVKHGVFLVLKSGVTATFTPRGRCFFNSTGNPGMATAGSGDSLTGLITALLAQGYPSLDACLLGVHLHGLAGDLAAEDHSQEAMMAGDMIDCFGKAFAYVMNFKLGIRN